MRCRAYQIPSEAYRDVEAQILEQLREGDLVQLRHLVGDHDLEIELLSGEWRVLFDELSDYYQVVDSRRRIARMAVSPDELSDFVATLRNPELAARWRPICFGLAELADALPVGSDLVGLVILEEGDDWLWTEPSFEIIALRPEVFELLQPHMRALMDANDYAALARLAEDHAEGCVEFSPDQWRVLLGHVRDRVPELISVFQDRIATPDDYNSIREALGQVADPRFQPSLDAWLRVHACMADYALYFRDASLELAEFQGEGLGAEGSGRRTTQPFRVLAPEEQQAGQVQGATLPGDTVPIPVSGGARPDPDDSTRR